MNLIPLFKKLEILTLTSEYIFSLMCYVMNGFKVKTVKESDVLIRVSSSEVIYAKYAKLEPKKWKQ